MTEVTKSNKYFLQKMLEKIKIHIYYKYLLIKSSISMY